MESIHPAREIAATGTLGAIPGIPADQGFPEFVIGVMFGVLGLCFLLSRLMDAIEKKGGGK